MQQDIADSNSSGDPPWSKAEPGTSATDLMEVMESTRADLPLRLRGTLMRAIRRALTGSCMGIELNKKTVDLLGPAAIARRLRACVLAPSE